MVFQRFLGGRGRRRWKKSSRGRWGGGPQGILNLDPTGKLRGGKNSTKLSKGGESGRGGKKRNVGARDHRLREGKEDPAPVEGEGTQKVTGEGASEGECFWGRALEWGEVSRKGKSHPSVRGG